MAIVGGMAFTFLKIRDNMNVNLFSIFFISNFS